MKKLITSILLFTYSIPVYAEETESDYGGILGPVKALLDAVNFIVDFFKGLADLVVVLVTQVVPSIAKFILAIISIISRFIVFIVTFFNIPPKELDSSIMEGFSYVINFKILGFTLIGLVTSLMIFFVTISIVKKVL